MRSYILNGWWVGAFLLVAVALCIMPAAPAQAGGTAKGEGVFLILSMEGGFDESEDGTVTLFVQIGSLFAGDTIENTRYQKKPNVSIKLPGKYKWKDLNGNAFTVLGSFDAPEESVHLITPEEAPEDEDGNLIPIPRKVQEAFFIASPELTDELEGAFPTTVEIAQFIYDTAIASTQPAPGPVPGNLDPTMGDWLGYDHTDEGQNEDPAAEAALSAGMIEQFIFRTGSDDVIDTTGEVFAEAEGDLFPHNPGPRLFGFDFAIEKKKKAKVDSNMEIDVEIDIKPGNADNTIEKSDNGVVWVAILTAVSDTQKDEDGNYIVTFDAELEVDRTLSTITLGPGLASPKAYKIEDVNHDGHKDITLKFPVNKIGLTTGTTEITLTAQTNADPDDDTLPDVPMTIVGSDHVTIKK